MIGKRWTLALEGLESGSITPVPFLDFRRQQDAAAFADRMNDRDRFRDDHRAEVTRWIVHDQGSWLHRFAERVSVWLDAADEPHPGGSA